MRVPNPQAAVLTDLPPLGAGKNVGKLLLATSHNAVFGEAQAVLDGWVAGSAGALPYPEQ
jgi:hypothetical protein